MHAFIFIYIYMYMFCVVAFPDSGVDGRGRYNMVSEPMVSTLSLDGPDKWSLDPRFRVEMVFGWNQFRTLECF
jgi:hypothetical protein